MKAYEFKHEMRGTSAVFGRNHGISVVFEGKRACTDGKQITLPAIPDDVDLTLEQVKVMRGYVDHEAGHIRHSDMPLIMDKYNRWCNSGKQALKDIHNCLEDIWMEEKVMDDYPGSAKNLHTTTKVMSEDALKEYKELGPEEREDLDKALGSFTHQGICNSIISVGREDYGVSANREYIEEAIPEHMQDHARGWCDLARKCKNSQEVVDLAKAVYKLMENPEAEDQDPQDFDPESGSDVEDGELGSEKGEGKGKGKGEPQDGKGKLGKELEELIDSLIPGGMGTNTGDYKGSYTIKTDKYDTVNSLKNPGDVEAFTKGDVDSYNSTHSRISSDVAVMKSKLRRALLSREQRDWDYGHESGKLDNKRLVAAYSRSPTVFKKRTERLEEDTAVCILVDLSGSMAGSKAKVAQECTVAVAECLEGTSITYSILGFDANYHDNGGGTWARSDANRMYDFKPFEQSLRKSRGALGLLHETGMHNNADRDAVVYSINELKARPESRKVLIVLSDGHPCHESSASTAQLSKYCKTVVDNSRKDGVECVGIGIKSDAVKSIYKDHIVVNSIKDLSGTMFNKLTSILLNSKGK